MVEAHNTHISTLNSKTQTDFSDKIDSIKSQNCKNTEQIFHIHRFQKLWDAWLQYADYHKTKRR